MPPPSSHKSENTTVNRATMASDLSPRERALYETGKKMFNDSIESGKEFCKLMVTVSMSAIPIYLYLLVFALPDDSDLGVIRGIMLLLPAITFLLSAIIFSIGFLLGNMHFSLDLNDDIERITIRTVRHRTRLIIFASLFFAGGCLVAMAVIVKAHL